MFYVHVETIGDNIFETADDMAQVLDMSDIIINGDRYYYRTMRFDSFGILEYGIKLKMFIYEDFNYISMNRLLEIINVYHRDHQPTWKEGDPNIRFRFDPVPGTGVRHWGCSYRHPRTTQELRSNLAFDGYVRGKRTKKFLSTFWDDVPKARQPHKSWKQAKRKRQWSL